MTELESDDRSVELSSIVAIYPEIQIDPSSPFKASLDLPVAPSSPAHICFQQLDTGFSPALTPPTSVDGSKADLAHPAIRDTHIISHLPPLSLNIELPDGYPSENPPIVHLGTCPPWLQSSVLTKLSDDCQRLWEECGKDLVVYTYIDHLQQLAETAFGIQDGPDGEVCLSRDLKVAMLDFNNKAEREKFEQETFECGVCLEPKKGVNCYRLLRCSHVFCIPCLQDFYNSCITEGDVDSVKCMAPDCTTNQGPTAVLTSESPVPKRKKRDRTLGPSELLQIPLAAETVQRYIFLKRKKKIEADKTTVYCPRQWCQGAARSKRHPKPADPMADDLDASDEEDGFVFDPLGDEAQLPPVAERVAICEDCDYAFCCVCKKGWHGELVRCFPRRQAEQTEEEKATEEYLRMYTSPCPTCNVPCQKRMGCNHMRCFQCDTHFCYLCSSWLSTENPYRHFNERSSKCYNRLWDMEGGDGLNPDGAEELHRIPEALLVFDDDPPDADSGSEDGDDRPVWDFDESDDDHERRHPPPPAPIPPQAPGPPRGAGLLDQRQNPIVLDAAARAAAERQAQARAIAEVRNRLDAGRPAQGADAPRGAQVDRERDRRIGLQRFLALVRNDREDEWDSDELDDF
ncbi:Zinc finger protein [Penicillium alfredii]|uniref:RBR-type E3 ubiquitin transferase n=1 Tax=Penicillium alfredii TaxID=1506179 RepID=A0A9W9K4K6_9EURO|nr:Zinc finger protein [Penicillium alfredii]KAJ5092401.1 Zinc finger protein [Penicillium alfredii]